MKSKPTYLARIPDAEAAIRATGDRLTQPRVAVLATLLATDHAISHLDVTDAIAHHHPIDRVTVYRVLEWLVSMGIAHRIAGDDRVWRFMLSHPPTTTAHHEGKAEGGRKKTKEGNGNYMVKTHHQHAHFTCNDCGQTFCLDDMPPKLDLKLPIGFKTVDIDLKLRGQCAHCTTRA